MRRHFSFVTTVDLGVLSYTWLCCPIGRQESTGILEPTVVVVDVWLLVVWLVIWLLPKVVVVDVFVGLGPIVVFIWLEGFVVVIWPGLCVVVVVVVVDNHGLFGIIETIVSVEIVGVVEFVGVPMVVATGSSLGTHLPDLHNYLTSGNIFCLE